MNQFHQNIDIVDIRDYKLKFVCGYDSHFC